MDKLPNLPNEIIMRIIREADGGRYKHKIYLNKVLDEIVSFKPTTYWDAEEVSVVDYGLEKNVILRKLYGDDEYDAVVMNTCDPAEFPCFGGYGFGNEWNDW